MHDDRLPADLAAEDDAQIIEPVGYDFGLSRRSFVQALGAGLLIVATAGPAIAQQQPQRGRGGGGGRRDSRPVPLEARLHLGKDGTITVMTGKVEGGQGARAQITQAAAEELRVPVERVRLIMADTALTPDDGITAGSRTTPSTLPSVRQACAGARLMLVQAAAKAWDLSPDAIGVNEGAATHAPTDKRLTDADLADGDTAALKQVAPPDVTVTPVADWKTLGTSVPRPNGRDLVTGAHPFPSDVIRPGMLYGKILRPPTYRAKLTEVDLAPAENVEGVVVVRDGSFVGVAAPTTYAAKEALVAIEATAKWDPAPHPSSAQVYDHLREHADGGVPRSPFEEEQKSAAKSLSATYHVAYVQHVPMEPRAAVAEWEGDDKLTVWTATQNPFGVRRELASAFHVDESNVRVIVPDFGGGFGGKHTGETAVEAARLARAAKKPVAVRWTRAEEMTWAAFRPAAVIDAAASLDDQGKLATWYFVNVNSGPSGLQPPYRVEKNESRFVQSDPPLRHGSYRALAATANHFARESFIDELADAAGADPLDFRLAHLEEPRLRAVLEEAASKFGWKERYGRKDGNVGVGLACGTEKASYVAACVEVEVDREKRSFVVRHVCQAYECGAITSPDNLLAQVHGCILMGLGPALREAVECQDGRILTTSLWKYRVPRFEDVPKLDIHLIDRPDLPPVGAGETPIVAIAPAIANALFHATGVRLREMPLRWQASA